MKKIILITMALLATASAHSEPVGACFNRQTAYCSEYYSDTVEEEVLKSKLCDGPDEVWIKECSGEPYCKTGYTYFETFHFNYSQYLDERDMCRILRGEYMD